MSDSVGVVLRNYNGREVLPRTLEHLFDAASLFDQVVLVDDGSTDGSPELAVRRYPATEVIRLPENTGESNVLRNLGLEALDTRFALILDNDVLIDPDGVQILASTLSRDPDVISVTPRLVYADRPERIYFDGAQVHFLALTTRSRRGVEVDQGETDEPFESIGSGIMMLDREMAGDMGYFDPAYPFGWGSDGEFHHRARLRGYSCLHVPRAVFRHVAREHGRERSRGQLTNRYRVMATLYDRRTLILLAPVLLAFEVALTLVAAVAGFFGERFTAIRSIWGEREAVLARRREIQSHRSVGDAQVLSSGPLALPGMMRDSRAMRSLSRVAGGLSDAYWGLVSPLLR